MITYWQAKPAAFLGECDAMTYCELTVNVLCRLINIMVFDSVVLYSLHCELSLAAQCIVIGPVSNGRVLFVGLLSQ